jgi:hypothetical protein
LFTLAACAPSAGSLETAVRDRPGVSRVEVSANSGDDWIPFTTIPKHVDVVMDANASASQVLSVFDALADEVSNGDVQSVELTLADTKSLALSTGAGVHATPAMVEDLLGARDDTRIVSYRREAHPVLPGVSITLTPGDIDTVTLVADRYREAVDIDLVEVRSGDFLLIRDSVNEDPARTRARELFVQRVDRRFRLTGAVVSGRGPLELFVSAIDVRALRGFVETRSSSEEVGRVVVRAKA